MGAQVTVALTQIEKQRLGYQAISLTNFAAATEPSVVAGSKIEVGGALFEFTSDETGTGWSGIGNNNDVYFYLVPSGSSSTWAYSTTAPTWSNSKQGWYNGLNRCFGGCVKDGSGNYTGKWLADNVLFDNPERDRAICASYKPVSGYSPAVGDPVEYFYDGTSTYIRKASRMGAELSQATGGSVNGFVCEIDANHFISFYYASLTLYGRICRVDPNDLSITELGASATSIYTYTTTRGSASCILYSANLLLLATTVSATGQLVVRTLSVDVSTGAITVNAGVNGAATTSAATLIKTDAGIAAVIYGVSATSIAAAGITVSGTTPTINTPAALTVTSHVIPSALPKCYGLALGATTTTTSIIWVGYKSASLNYLCYFTVTNAGVAAAGSETTIGSFVPVAQTDNLPVVEPRSNHLQVLIITSAGVFLMAIRKITTTGLSMTSAPTTLSPIGICATSTDRAMLFKCGDSPEFICALTHTSTLGVSNGPVSFFYILEKESGDSIPTSQIWKVKDGFHISGVGSEIHEPWACVLPYSGTIIICSGSYNSAGYKVRACRKSGMLAGVVTSGGRVLRYGELTTSGLTAGGHYGVDVAGALALNEYPRVGVAISSTRLSLMIGADR